MAPPALAARFHDAPPCLHGMNSQFGGSPRQESFLWPDLASATTR
jgi:hypothetical protein